MESVILLGYLVGAILELFVSILNSSFSFFNLMTDVAETSSCTYVLTYFLIDQVSLTSVIHNNLSSFKSRINLSSFNSHAMLTKYLWLGSSQKLL
jgi:hypothetical protein